MRNVLAVSFKEKEQDLKDFLIEHSYVDNFSYYVKELIKKDMKREENVDEKAEKK